MSLSYEFDHKLAQLAPILDEHAEWFSYVMRRILYPELQISHQPPVTDASFRQWVGLAEQQGGIDAARLQAVCEVFADLQQLADRLMAMPAGQKPEVAAFDELIDRYDDFQQQIRRLEYDAVQEDSGMDADTGLRSRKAMEKDLERELERRARLGKPFCLVLARLDDMPALREKLSIEAHAKLVRAIAVQVLFCIRSFDDAYRLSDGEFVMALKHSDTAGGTAAINRLRRLLEENPVSFEDEGTLKNTTMSYCTAEPVPGDSLENLLQHMRHDLNRYNQGGDSSVEYIEQSPLQRFILAEQAK